MIWTSWHAATTQQKWATNGCVQRIHKVLILLHEIKIGNIYNIFIFTKLNNKHVRIEKKKPFKIRNWFLIFCLTFRITEVGNILVALQSLFQVSKQTTEDIKPKQITDNDSQSPEALSTRQGDKTIVIFLRLLPSSCFFFPLCSFPTQPISLTAYKENNLGFPL